MAEWTHRITMCSHPQFEALGALMNGGSVFLIPPPEPNRSWCLVDRNKRHVEYFWKRGSESLPLLLEACDRHNFQTDGPSWSRLCKHIWETEINPTPSRFRCHPYAIKLATDKRHWHQTKCIPGLYPSITEIDIKSAYAQSFANQPSIWLKSHEEYEDDKGAIDRWKSLYPQLDKRTRLAMIGWLSGYEFTCIKAGPTATAPLIKYKIKKTYDGGVFNAIHIALYRLYQLLREVESIDPPNVPRIHTDSLWIDSRIRTDRLNTMLNCIKANNYQLAIKGHGQAHLWDLNSGCLGGRAIGIPQKVLTQFEYDRVQYPWMMEEVAPLDDRFLGYPYRNERYSITKLQAIMKMRKESLLVL